MSDDNSLPIIGPSGPTRADAVRNYNLLLRTARQLFEERGVANVSMTEVAQAAHVGKGTLYRHFENKTELCYALLDDEQRTLQESTFKRLRQNNPPCDDLRWLLEQTASFILRNMDFLGPALDASQGSSLVAPAHLWWRQTIRALLGRLNLAGDLDYLADVFYVMLDVNTIRFQRHQLDYSPERILDGLEEVVDRVVTAP